MMTRYLVLFVPVFAMWMQVHNPDTELFGAEQSDFSQGGGAGFGGQGFGGGADGTGKGKGKGKGKGGQPALQGGVNMQDGGDALSEYVNLDKRKIVKFIQDMEKKGQNPESLLDLIPTGHYGAEWLLRQVPLAQALSPDIIVGGISDASLENMVMKHLMKAMGVTMCKKVDAFGNNIPSDQTRPAVLRNVLQSSGGSISMKGYSKSPDDFITMVKDQVRGAYLTRKCISDSGTKIKKSTVWGYKNPMNAMLIPAIGATFGVHPKIVLLVSDPREMCSAQHQMKFRQLCSTVLNKEQCVPRGDCYTFWATVLNEIVEKYKTKDSICFIRVEDMIMNPNAEGAESPGIVRRLTKHLNLDLSYEDTLAELTELHKFNNSFILGRVNTDERNSPDWKKTVQMETATHQDPIIRTVMTMFGYSATKMDRLGAPTVSMMC